MRAKQNTRGNRKSAPVIRREEAGEHPHHGGAWKVAYADFVTAMMAFFLLMWLMNATTEDQRKGLADYFSPTNLLSHNSSGTGQPFGGHTAFDKGALVSDRGATQITPGQRPVRDNLDDDDFEVPDHPGVASQSIDAAGRSAGQPIAAGNQGAAAPAGAPRPDNPAASGQSASGQLGSGQSASGQAAGAQSAGTQSTLARSVPAELSLNRSPAGTTPAPSQPASPADRAAAERRELAAAAREIKEAVQGDPALAGLADHLSVDITPEGLRIQLLDTQNQPMFAFGSALPNEAARLLLDKIGPVLRRLPEQVSIAGHTDAAPYPGRTMTNWELSIDRANAARRLLLAAGLPEQRLRDVVGHADHDLLLPADPLAAANRRIAIMVLRGTSAPIAPPAQGEKPADEQGPGRQTQGAQVYLEQTPAGQAPGGQSPGGQAAGGQVPEGQVPGGQVPGGQVPGDPVHGPIPLGVPHPAPTAAPTPQGKAETVTLPLSSAVPGAGVRAPGPPPRWLPAAEPAQAGQPSGTPAPGGQASGP